MKIFSLVCLCMTVGIAMAAGYGSYSGSYGYSYLPYAAPQSGVPGVGQGGILVVLGVLFIFLLLIGNNGSGLFGSSSSSNPTISLVG